MPPLSALVETFVLLAAVIDPVGTLPVFLAVTARHAPAERTGIAVRAVGIAAGILLFFIVAGQLLLDAMHVPLAAFQVSGGVVLFLFALTMIFGDGKLASELEAARSGTETAIFPLAVPSIASPGAMMAVVLLTDNARYSFLEQLATTLALLVVLALTLLLLLAAPWVHRKLGDSGASIVSRIMGLVLAAVATTHVLDGLRAYFSTPR
jgi:multiple antibiotic resistance protein